jgi:predicted dehydrogenase
MKKTTIGIIGCGNISSIYFRMCRTFDILNVAACADLLIDRAKARAEEFKIPKACSVDEILSDPSIQIIVNLTIPNAHASVAKAALLAGKSVYNEKPLSISRDDARELLDIAKKKGLLVGGAPDTFMGAGLQTCRKLIDDGAIGAPVGATAFMMCRGHESWHPDPEFYYKAGGGPMFDMGPYYLTALVSLIGPVRRVTGSTRTTFELRTITSKPKNGTKIVVDVPTYVAGMMDFSCGAIGTIITTFDVHAARLPLIEIYGADGSLSVPDPNGFGGAVSLRKGGSKEWEEIPLTHNYADNSRGIGVADMAYSLLRKGRPHRANGAMAYHVLDIMHAFHDASDAGAHVSLASTCERPAALPQGLKPGTLDA